jgi:hypothetical protein
LLHYGLLHTMRLLTIIIQVQVLCGWSSLAEKCGGVSSAADCRAAMSSKGGEVSSREILNGKLSCGLDALAGFGDEEKLNDNRDFSCLVVPKTFFLYLTRNASLLTVASSAPG